MKTEPGFEKSAVCGLLLREYGLCVEQLEFLPTPWTAYCYRVVTAAGERFFLKLTAPAGFVPYCAGDPVFYLPLTHQLHRLGILSHLAYPIPARSGRFLLTVEGYHLILFNYIDGEPLGFGTWPAGLSTRLACLLGSLHRRSCEVHLENVLSDRFALPFENDLLHALERLQQVTSLDRQGVRDLRDLLLPRRAELLHLVARLKELQRYAIAAAKSQVVCHTDLHGGNLMLDADGNLYIVDWEGAILAPCEHDLFFFVDGDDFWQTFLPAYESEFGPVQLDALIFGFYSYRRNLEDLADWVVRILDYNTAPEQDEEDLDGLVSDCLSGWAYLEQNIRRIEIRLAQRRTNPGENDLGTLLTDL